MSKFFTEDDNAEMLTNKARVEAEAEARQVAELQEERNKERRNRIAKRLPFLKAIAAAVPTAESYDDKAHKATVDEEAGTLHIDGVEVGSLIDLDEMRTRGIGRFGIGSRSTGRMFLRVGTYGDRTNYPQKKDGSFSYDKIASSLIGKASRKNADNKMARDVDGNKPRVVHLLTELGYKSAYDTYGKPDLTASSDPALPVRFKFTIEKNLSLDDAKALFHSLKKLGLLRD